MVHKSLWCPPQTLEEPRGELPEIPPWPWSKFEHGCSAEEWSSWERRQRERHERDHGVHEWTHGMLGATSNLHRDDCGVGCTDKEVLTAGFIPDGMNYMMVKDVMNLALQLD